MNKKDIWHDFKCFGSVTVGPRGQVVIPANARKELGIEAGTTLLVFLGPGGNGLLLFKADTVEEIVKMVSEGLGSVRKLVKKHLQSEAVARTSREEMNAKQN